MRVQDFFISHEGAKMRQDYRIGWEILCLDWILDLEILLTAGEVVRDYWQGV
jgi:hypothetical protein